MIELTQEKMVANLKFVVYAPFSKSASNLFGHEVHHLNSKTFDRWDAFKMFPESWICFLDADCTLDEKLVAEVRKNLPGLNTFTVLCGRYKSTKAASHITRAYNILCNTWLEAGLLVGEPRVLGGFFVIFSSNKLRLVEFEKFPKWGAEDYRMARQLGKHDFNFKLSNVLFTDHEPNSDLFWLFKRAWIHGCHRPENVQTNARHWLKVLVRQNFFSNSFIAMHFITVFASKSLNGPKLVFESLKAFFNSLSKEQSNSPRV